MNLTMQERETIILFNEADDTASVDTCNPALIRKLDKQIALQENGPIALLHEDEFGKRYLIPKSWVKVQFPRTLSPEQRAELSARGKANRQAQLDRAHTTANEPAPDATTDQSQA